MQGDRQIAQYSDKGVAMVRVEFLGPISHISPLELEVSNIDALKERLSKEPELTTWLEISAVAVNDEIITELSYPLKSGDKITLLPPVCGG